jgi:hypothetical protein
MRGRRHSAETRRLIGDGVRRAAQARRWRELPPSARDHIVGAVFARLTLWWSEGKLPELTAVRREAFEAMPQAEQQRFLAKVVVAITPPVPEAETLQIVYADGRRFSVRNQLEIEFVDGSHWPARPTREPPLSAFGPGS